MSSVIDPVTGLPIVVPLTTGLDTIPLGVQTFPWRDYKATQRPNRQLLYPDDIIPVSANVAGMYQDQAQAVGTDGNHALLTFVVNQSGGGGSNPTPIMYQKYVYSLDFLATDTSHTDIPFFMVIALMMVSWKFTTLNTVSESPVVMNIVNQGSDIDFQGLAFAADTVSAGQNVSAPVNIVLPFNPPWQIRTSTAFLDSLYTVEISGNDGAGTVVLTTWGYNLP